VQFSARKLSSRARFALSATVALVAAGILAAGISVPASAVTALTDYTVKVVNKAGTPLTGIDVYALQVANGSEAMQDPAWQAVPVSGKSGYYKFSATQPSGHKAGSAPTNGQLQVGTTYTLEFDPTGAPAKSAFSQLLGGATFIDDATTFSPSASSTSLTASLAGNGAIAGKITSPTGAVLSHAAVQAYNFDGTNWFPYSFTYTASNGTYSLTDIDPGSYRIEVYPAAGNYPPIYSGGAHTFDQASSVYVGLGVTATVNEKFTAGTGSIAGTSNIFYDDFGITVPFEKATPVAIPVTGETGTAPNAAPTAIDLDKSVYGGASSSKGAWSISGLTPGDYIVQMQPYYIGDPAYFLGSGDPVSTFTQARVFTVANGAKVAAGTSQFSGDAEQGAFLDVNVNLASSPYTGVLQYSLTNDTVSYESESLSDNTGSVQLGFDQSVNGGDGGGLLQPGKYTLTVVDPSGTYAPFKQDVVLQTGENSLGGGTLALAAPSPQPGFSSAASIAETATTVGTTYTVAATSARSTATTSYQWFRGTHAIFGADAASYTSIGTDIGTQLSVRVTESEFGLTPQYSYASVTSGVVTQGAAANLTTAPTVSPAGNQFIGAVLTATPGAWDASGLTYKYQWLSNGAPISGATAKTYAVTAADTLAGSTISVQVTAVRTGYADSTPAASSTSATATLHPAPVAKTAPTLSYKYVGANEFVTVKSGSWSVAGVTLSYAWVWPDNSTHAGATTEFTKGATAPEPRLAQVTASKPGYASGQASVVAVKGTNAVTQVTPETLVDSTSGLTVGHLGDTLPIGDKISIATPGAWQIDGSPAAVSLKYTWQRTAGGKTTTVSSATSYTVSTKDVGATFQVTESATSAKYTSGVSITVPVGMGTTNGILVAHPAAVSLPTTAAPGQIVKPTVTAWKTTGVTQKYQWFEKTDPTASTNLADYTAIAKATASSLKLVAGWSRVLVVVTGVKTGYTQEPVTSTVSLAVNAAKVTHAPAIVKSSDDLQVTAGTATPVGGTWTYQWYTGAETDGPSSTTPPEHPFATSGQALSLEATYTGGTSTATVRLVAQKGTATITSDKTIKGSRYGDTLQLNAAAPISMPGGVAPAFAYQWYVTGKAISGATKSTYAVSSSYIGKSVTVKISASSALYNSTSFTSPGVTIGVGSFGDVGSPTVSPSGTVRPGATLTVAHGSGFAASGVTYSYVWKRSVGGGAYLAIPGATKSAYVLQLADVNNNVEAFVTASRSHFTSVTLPSSPIPVAPPVAIAATVAPSITGVTAAGTAQVGGKLTVNVGTWNTASLTYAYQWYRNNIAIPGATGSTYTPIATSYGDQVQAQVTVSRTGYGTASAYTQALIVALGAAPAPTSTPKITKSGSNYIVSLPAWTVDGLTFSYQWQVAGVNATGTGAATDTYTPVAGDHGALSVIITAMRNGYTPGSKTVAGPILAGSL
jgi:hypothetical protein